MSSFEKRFSRSKIDSRQMSQTSAIHNHWANDSAWCGTFIYLLVLRCDKISRGLWFISKWMEILEPLTRFVGWKIRFIQKAVTLPLICCVTLENHFSSVIFSHTLNSWLWDHQAVLFHHLWCKLDFDIFSRGIHFFRGNSSYFWYHLIVNWQTISKSFKQRILLC